jgi:pyruvate,water dikinase
LSDSVTDFSNVTWREEPELVLQLIAGYPAPVAHTAPPVRFDDLPLRGFRRLHLRFWYQRAQRFRLLREAFSAVYARGLSLIRATFLGLGDRIVARGYLHERNDIFYLYEEEIHQCVAGQLSGEGIAALVEQRKREMVLSRDAELPPVIYGDEQPPLVPAQRQTLRGTPTSPGYYTGLVKVVHGISEFGKLAPGDVLVVPYSDVAWTPLFASAGAVVAESGGMLSHSAIIAREYGIPAVVSVEGALSLPDHARVTVSGFSGEVILHQEETS